MREDLAGSILAGILSDAERTPPDRLYSEPHWYACYTRARHEKQVEAHGLKKGEFELTALFGYYSTLALQLRVFRVD